MHRKYVGVSHREEWDEADMKRAIVTVKANIMNLKKAFKESQVSKTTLCRRVRGKIKVVIGSTKVRHCLAQARQWFFFHPTFI